MTASVLRSQFDTLCKKLKGPKPGWSTYGGELANLDTVKFWSLREQVASILKFTVKKIEDYDEPVMDSPTGVRYRFSRERNSQKVSLSAYKDIGGENDHENWWHRAKDFLGLKGKDEISFTVSRGADAIANDIQRRLIPVAEMIAGRAQELRDERHAAINQLDHASQRFQAAVPGVKEYRPRHSSGRHSSREFDINVDCISGLSLSINEQGEPEIELDVRHVPVHLAVEFIKSLQSTMPTTPIETD